MEEKGVRVVWRRRVWGWYGGEACGGGMEEKGMGMVWRRRCGGGMEETGHLGVVWKRLDILEWYGRDWTSWSGWRRWGVWEWRELWKYVWRRVVMPACTWGGEGRVEAVQ